MEISALCTLYVSNKLVKLNNVGNNHFQDVVLVTTASTQILTAVNVNPVL